MHVCLCTYIYLCVLCVHTYVRTYIRTCVCVHVYMRVCVCTCTNLCMYIQVDVDVVGDIRLVLYNAPSAGAQSVACFVCFHTGFISEKVTNFTKEAIDMASSDTKCRIFDASFQLSLHFAHVPQAHVHVQPFPDTPNAPVTGGRAATCSQPSQPATESTAPSVQGGGPELERASNYDTAVLGTFRGLPKPTARTKARSEQYLGGGREGNVTTVGQTFQIKVERGAGGLCWHMCVQMCVCWLRMASCIHPPTHTPTNVRAQIKTHMHTRTTARARAHTHTHTRTNIQTHKNITNTHTQQTRKNKNTPTNTHKHTHTHAHTHTNTQGSWKERRQRGMDWCLWSTAYW